MRATLRPHQKNLLSQIIDGFKKNNKGLVTAACSTGKTILATAFIEKAVQDKKRVAVSTYSKVDIRNQWVNEIRNKAPNLLKYVQVVCAKHDLKKLLGMGIPAVSNGDVSQDKLITIFIPQSVSKSSMGKFDYIIVDEAHEYLDVMKLVDGVITPGSGILKKTIKKHSHKRTCVLGLTGTGFELMLEGGYFNKAFCIFYDMPTALEDGIINDCELSAEYFGFDLDNKFYNSNDNLNKKGVKFLNSQFNFDRPLNKEGKQFIRYKLNEEKIKKILQNLEGKTLIVVSGGVNENGQGTERSIREFINYEFGNGKVIAVEKSSRLSKVEQNDNEEDFKNNPNIKFMVVIDMCCTGWDFPELQNVVDLTFTKNPKVIIQRLSRAIRKCNNKKISKYIYCADQSKSVRFVRFYLCQALELTTESGIRLYDKKGCKVWDKFINAKAEEMEDGTKLSIGRFTAKEYYDYDKLLKGVHTKTVLRKSLSDIRREEKMGLLHRTIGTFIIKLGIEEIKRPQNLKMLEELLKIKKDSKNDENEQVYKSLSLIKEGFPKYFNDIFGQITIEEIMA